VKLERTSTTEPYPRTHRVKRTAARRWGGRLLIYCASRLCVNADMSDSMFTMATITGLLLATAAGIRAFRAVENQTLAAIVAGKALWAELAFFKKRFRV
jgi:hypothetical protein